MFQSTNKCIECAKFLENLEKIQLIAIKLSLYLFFQKILKMRHKQTVVSVAAVLIVDTIADNLKLEIPL